MIVKSTAAIQCSHCSMPVPRGLIDPDAENQYCCQGCKTAYSIIHDHGLDGFYDMTATSADAMSLKDRELSQARFSEFDLESFLQKFAMRRSDTEHQIELAIDGIHCAACIWLIEKLPLILPGVIDARVNWSRGTVIVRWNPKSIPLSHVARTLNQLGYTPCPLRNSNRQARFQAENRRQLARIGVAAALAGNSMILSAALYIGEFSGMSPEITMLLRIASCIIGTAALLFPGRTFLNTAFNAIRTRTAHMDLPIALALTVGTVAGLVNVVIDNGEIYFDSLSVLIFLLLIGRWLQFRQQSKAADSVEMLYRLTPKTTQKIVAGKVVETMVDLVEIGDELEIRVGDVVPADGMITSGSTQMDESLLTGESIPVCKVTSDSVAAGTTNRAAVFRMKVSAAGDDTRLAKIVALVEHAADSKPKVVQWADKIGGYFVGVVLALAAVTWLVWVPQGTTMAVDRTIALLIVACPCALALATPLAISVALGRAARRGIMIKGGDVLQSLNKPGMLWLDKTGTLTEGELQVIRWHGSTNHFAAIAAIEEKSVHPMAKAIKIFALHNENSNPSWIGGEPSEVQVREWIGMGVVGQVDNNEFLIGNEKLLQQFEVVPGKGQLALSHQIEKHGWSPIWISRNGKVVSIVAVADHLRDDAFESVERLRRRGWQIGILSGDQQTIVNRVGNRLNIATQYCIGEISPEEKLRIVAESVRSENVVMVGDGVNDCAALAAASVGLAVKNGAEASLAAAPVYLSDPGLSPILELLEISQSTTRTMRFNLAISLVYNFSFAIAAFLGWVNPLVAAIIMPISSLTVVSMSLAAGKTRGIGSK